jgi:hypothetical protein
VSQRRRLEELSSLLSEMALETAAARRDARQLKQENAALRGRLSRLTFHQPGREGNRTTRRPSR